jgi:hypothetical protein
MSDTNFDPFLYHPSLPRPPSPTRGLRGGSIRRPQTTARRLHGDRGAKASARRSYVGVRGLTVRGPTRGGRMRACDLDNWMEEEIPSWHVLGTVKLTAFKAMQGA